MIGSLWHCKPLEISLATKINVWLDYNHLVLALLGRIKHQETIYCSETVVTFFNQTILDFIGKLQNQMKKCT